MESNPALLVDRFGRQVDYVRISVTDRCDFRCVYCMAEDMTFVPKPQVMSLEEIFQVTQAFAELGVRKIRLTGGEPLIRNNIMNLIERIGDIPGVEQLAITTNGSQLMRLAPALKDAGVDRLNISLDSLNQRLFRQLTRTGNLEQVIAGIDAAVAQGFSGVKINAVILKGRNDGEIPALVEFARQRGIDIAFIEEMPLGHIDDHDRALTFISSEEVRDIIDRRHPLEPLEQNETGAGPSRYYSMSDSPSRIGFISPHSHNFCHLCNRVRVTAEGRLLLCLGNEHSADLKTILRGPEATQDNLKAAIAAAMDLKPERHWFDNSQEPQIVRFMNTTGG